MKIICDVIVYENIEKILENIRFEHRAYLLKERILLFFYSGYSHYKIYNFNNKKEINIWTKDRDEPFHLSKEVLIAITKETFDFKFQYKNVEYDIRNFTDKDMMEPIETEDIKDFSIYKEKKLSSLNMIKILRAKNVKVIRRMLLTDDYAYDNATKFGEGNELDKFNLINKLKRGGTKGYSFRYENEKDISGSCYSFDFFNVVV